jgi:hypothetical protein
LEQDIASSEQRRKGCWPPIRQIFDNYFAALIEAECGTDADFFVAFLGLYCMLGSVHAILFHDGNVEQTRGIVGKRYRHVAMLLLRLEGTRCRNTHLA